MVLGKLGWLQNHVPYVELERDWASVAEIRPFRGVRYNQLLTGDLSQVICSPYDIITPPLQQELYRRGQYNFVRLEHSRELPQDTVMDNKYTRPAATLRQWLSKVFLRSMRCQLSISTTTTLPTRERNIDAAV